MEWLYANAGVIAGICFTLVLIWVIVMVVVCASTPTPPPDPTIWQGRRDRKIQR